MKKKLFTLFVTPLLIGCVKQNNVVEKEDEKEVSYDHYSSLNLLWNELFLPAEPSYFAYIYSETCHYCKQIKDDIFEFIESDIYPIYLINFNKDIPVSNNIECTIGATKVDNVWIEGTPTLIHVMNKHVFANLAGGEKILTYIDLFISSYDTILYDLM